MSSKKETKTVSSKKISTGTVPMNQRSPNSKIHNKTAVTTANSLKDANHTKKPDTNFGLTPIKPSPTKTSRNQVSANWNSVAGTIKPPRSTASAKKSGAKLIWSSVKSEYRCTIKSQILK